MHNAWEFDRFIELAEDIDIKVDWCMQVHYSLEDDGDYGLYMWDWDANELGQQEGWGPNQGYCYKTQLGLPEVIDFFSDPVAISNYKKKLRYNIARWGYSTAISNIELFSEINNAGEKDSNDKRRYINDMQFRTEVFNWQLCMAQYIKEDLMHTQHVLSSSYGGTPNGQSGNPYSKELCYDVFCDFPESIPNVGNCANCDSDGDENCFVSECECCSIDLPSYMFLGPGEDLTYTSNPYFDVYCQSAYSPSQYLYQISGRQIQHMPKPFIFSEIGVGDGFFACSRPVNNIRTLLISPFTGAAGAGFNWDNYTNPNHDHWYLYENVVSFFEGLHLNSESYEPWSRRRGHYYGDCNDPNLKREDGYTTVYYLKAGSNETNDIRMIGCVVNNLYNEYQSHEDAGYNSCGSAIYDMPGGFDGRIHDVENLESNDPDPENEFFLLFHSVLHDVPQTTLVLDNLNQNRTYTVHYYDPFSGEYFEPVDFEPENCGGGSGNEGFLRLYHPELTWDRPILFFELYDNGLSGVRSTQTNTAMAQMLSSNGAEQDQFAASVKETPTSLIRVFPNPTSEVLNVELGSEMVGTYQVFNSVGALVLEGTATPSFQLSIPTSGEYILRIQSGEGVFYERITVVR